MSRHEREPRDRTGRPGRSVFLTLALLLATGLALAPAARVRADDPGDRASERKKDRKNYAAGEWAFKKLSEAHELLAEEKYDDARRLMDEMSRRKSLNPHEQALMWQTYAYIQSSQEQYDQAVTSFEKCLALDAMPEAAMLGTQYNLGQLYMSVGRYRDAVKVLVDWLGKVENPAASAYYLVSMAYVQLEDVKNALPYAKKAVAADKKPTESHLQLLLALEFELKHYPQVADVLEVLVTHFPKKNYFLQLAAVYGELRREKRSLATLELAYVQDLLDRESELLNLAQAYLYHDIPYRAAQVLEKGLADEIVSEDAKNWQLLGDAWLHAREYDQALEPLRRAAALAEDGNLYVRIAQVHLERDESRKAMEALEKALSKGNLDNPGHAYLLLGITHTGAKRYAAARKAFAQAGEYEKSRTAARDWMKHLEHQEAIQ
jgi:tetratricopeptide (TPR) repeat protein